MDDKKEAIATRITIVLFVLILAAAAGVFAYTLKLHGCYKNSIQVTAKIDDIAIDNQSNIQVTYKYTYNGKEYTTQRSSRVEEMKRGDKKEIKIMLGIGNLLMFDGKYTSAELMFERILIRFSSDIGEEERCCIKRASEKLIALYGDLDFDSEEYKRIAEFAAFL